MLDTVSGDSGSCLARLRAGTREAHARLERVAPMARLLAPDLTQAEYVSVLQHMHGFHAAFEPAIAAGLAAWPAAAAALDDARPTALAADLAWFGARPLLRPKPPCLDDPAAALGALYVVEGAALGGRVIARHLADSLGVSPGRGGSFYGAHSAEAARLRWRGFCALLEQPPAAVQVAGAALVAGAVSLFDFLEHWLQQIERPAGERGPERNRSGAVAVAA